MKWKLPVLAVALASTTLFGGAITQTERAAHAITIPDDVKIGGFAIGAQAWTFNGFTTSEAIDKTAAAGARVIELYPGQKLSGDGDDKVDQHMSPEAVEKLKKHLAEKNIKVVAFGVTGISKNEDEARKLFEWAKTMDIAILNTESVDALDTIEKMVKEYDIKVGFHDHPKRENDPNYKLWDPNYVLSIVKDRDKRIGACADTGHWVRSGIRPVDALKILEGRIVSSHLKDLHEFSPGGHDVPYGSGVSEIPAILAELKRQNFNGSLSVEYEYNWGNSLPDVAQCIGFVRAIGEMQAMNTMPKKLAVAPDTREVKLFNGQNLDGWIWVAGDGKTPVEKVWRVEDGVLKCSGNPAGYIRTGKQYTNYLLRLQWRFDKPGNSGVLMRLHGPDKVWPRSIEAQLQHQSAGDIWNIDKYPMKVVQERTTDRHTVKANPTNERAVGEWNDYEIRLDGENLSIKVNGLEQNVASEVAIIPGTLGLQSEGAAIEFRNIVLTPLA